EAAVRLNADHDLPRILRVVCQEGVELPNPFEAIRDPSLGHHRPGLVQDTDVVVCFGPIDSNKDHPTSPPLEICGEPEETRVELIDQCSRHAIPPVVSSPR